MTLVLLDDELDERCNTSPELSYCQVYPQMGLSGETKTTTNVFEVSDLEAPVFQGAYVHKDTAIDHNLYIWGTVHRKGWGGNPPMEYYPDPRYAYMNNYLAGLRIIDISSSDYTDWYEAAFFDTSQGENTDDFAGSWSGYLHPSGIYAISSIENGVIFLQPSTVFTDDFPQGPADPPVDPPAPCPPSSDLDDLLEILLVVAVVLVAMLAFYLCWSVTCSCCSSEARSEAAKEKAIKKAAKIDV